MNTPISLCKPHNLTKFVVIAGCALGILSGCALPVGNHTPKINWKPKAPSSPVDLDAAKDRYRAVLQQASGSDREPTAETTKFRDLCTVAINIGSPDKILHDSDINPALEANGFNKAKEDSLPSGLGAWYALEKKGDAIFEYDWQGSSGMSVYVRTTNDQCTS